MSAESQLTTHDLEIPFGSGVDPSTGHTLVTRKLRVLLLAPSALSDEKLSNTIERIEHFASLTGGQDLAIVFLLNPRPVSSFLSTKQLVAEGADRDSKQDGIFSYSKLQAEMINHTEISYVPILPLAQVEGLSELLTKHAANLARSTPKQNGTATTLELLQFCTANPPMSQQTALILSDLFPNLKDLATACSSVTSAPNSGSPSVRAPSSQADGIYDLGLGMSTQNSDSSTKGKLKRLRDLCGDQECRDIVDFWKEEWTVD